ncbi:MAG: two-component regulator propeller domain-containing protein, partial [Bacteroidales bacterium]|nr:two-component regulator propeller domain-containing protein [Bacteroidales bacterium]
MRVYVHFIFNLSKDFFFVVLFLFSFFISLLSFAQNTATQNLNFKHLTIDDGLSQNAVFAILQDSKGFMWFGTKDGLNRYDGYNFMIFQHNPFDSTTLSSNFITRLYEDRKGNIWIGTIDAGVNVIHKLTGKLLRVKIETSDSTFGARFEVKAIAEDDDGSIWLGTKGDGLLKLSNINLEASNWQVRHFTHQSGKTNSLTSNTINDIKIEGPVIWIATPDGLNKFDTDNEQFSFYEIHSRHPQAPTNSNIPDGISTIYETRNKDLWLGTISGLVKFDRKSGKYEVHNHHYEIYRYGWGAVSRMIEDKEGYLWIATPGELMRFNPSLKSFEFFRNDPLNPKSISYNAISSLFIDKTDILWIGTTGMGLSIHDPKAQKFKLYNRKPEPDSRISGFSIKSILEDHDGNIWIGTDVLNRWERGRDRFISYEKSSDSLNAFGNTNVFMMITTENKYLWNATTEGLFRYELNTGVSKHYRHHPAKIKGLPQKEVYAVFEDHKGRILLLTENYLCWLTNQEEGIFECIRYQTGPSYGQQVRPVIFEDVQNRVWLGTKDGLMLLNDDRKTFKVFKNDPKNLTSLNNNLIKSICADPLEPQRFLWIGTNGGLNRFDIDNETFEYYTEEDGLPNNVLYGILHDKENRLWLSTNKGISCFDPKTKTFRNFDAKDGLQSNEFNTGAYYRSKSGELFFGGIKGLNYFYPHEIEGNPNIPAIVLTSLKLGDQYITPQQHPSVLKNSLAETSVIKINFDNSLISFEFAALDYSAPEKNQYAYFLENYNNNWIYSGTVRAATYTNLPPGEYVFRVKGSNNDGVWNENGIAIKLIIMPPWWATWWAYLIYGLLSFSILLVIRRYEMNRLRLRNQLEVEKIETDSLRKMDHLKSHFFANISHEFRTPLTLILGQIENVMTSEVDAGIKTRLQVAKRNSQRLLTLINQLLDLSKLESGKMELEVSRHNIVSFLKSLFYTFEFYAVSKHLHLHFHSKIPNIQLNFD